MTDYTQLLNVARTIEYDDDATAGLVSELADALERLTTPPAQGTWSCESGCTEPSAVCILDHRQRKYTPPTDVERDLAQALFRTLFDAGVSFESNDLIPRLTATVRAAGFRRQVPITDEWEYATRRVSGGGLPYLQYDLESARRFIDNPPIGIVRYEGDPFVAIRRRKAGPWEPVEAGKDA